jgi:hypothetical protein
VASVVVLKEHAPISNSQPEGRIAAQTAYIALIGLREPLDGSTHARRPPHQGVADRAAHGESTGSPKPLQREAVVVNQLAAGHFRPGLGKRGAVAICKWLVFPGGGEQELQHPVVLAQCSQVQLGARQAILVQLVDQLV